MQKNNITQECPDCHEDVPVHLFVKHILKHSKGGNKHHAKRVECDGYIFASGAERDRYLQLKVMEQAGLIRDLELQPKFPCVVEGVHVTLYTADFRYYDLQVNDWIVEDVKGVRTEAFVVRKKLTQALYKIVVHEIKM